jgi:hypothetical protein
LLPELLVAAGDTVILLQAMGLGLSTTSSSGYTSLFCALPHLKLMNGRRPFRFLGDGVSGFGRPLTDGGDSITAAGGFAKDPALLL